MTFHIITVVPDLVKPYLTGSILGRGLSRGLIKVKVYDLRAFAKDKHRRVDDKPYGGGPGMVLMLEPLIRALVQILRGRLKKTTKVLITAPGGKQLDGQTAKNLAAKMKDIIIVAGRYEGVDGRLASILKSKNGFAVNVAEISIGPYVLTGGELPALIIVDAVARHINGVLGKSESLEEKRLGVGVPVYTRPETFPFRGRKYQTPPALISGDHQSIAAWRRQNRKISK